LSVTPIGQRADARRNRARIVEAAKRVFATDGDVGPEAVAREAGVGVGTLYRHFPDRNDLAAAVYEDELLLVASRASELLEVHAPAEALRLWMDRFVERIENKRAMATALRSLVESGAATSASTRAMLAAAAQQILDAGMASGEFRPGLRGEDFVTTLVGVCVVTATPEGGRQLPGLLDFLAAGVAAR
jgi:AcrR family transcriptional regulator